MSTATLQTTSGKGNPYHDADGKFCSRDAMRKGLKEALVKGDVSTWLRMKNDLVQADLETHYLPTKKRGYTHPAIENVEDDIAKRDEILANGTTAEVSAWLQARTENQHFHDLVDERDLLKTRAKIVHEEYKLLKEAANDNPEMNYELVRAKGFEAQDLYEELQVLKGQIETYKDVTALAAAKLSEKIADDQKAAGTYREYTENTLNNLTATGEFPSGSREWLEQRQKGIGGSDVGKIVGVDSDKSSNSQNYKEVFASKVDPITDEEVETQASGHSEYTGYAGRGNAWENLILQRFAENNPNANITHCKTSWQNNENKYQFANFDGLMTDENGKPNGIVEIKTASDPLKWGNPKDGLDGVPPGYRAQALWYADAAGFEKGAVAVLIDDRTYREYHFEMTPALKAEVARYKTKIGYFVKDVEKVKAGDKDADPRISRPRYGRERFSTSFLQNAYRGNDDAFKEVAVLREEPIEATKARFKEIWDGEKTPESARAAMTKLYKEKPLNERKQNFIHIDLETSSTDETKGHILEVGMSIHQPTGGEVEAFSQLYGVPKRAQHGIGTGPVHVHNITPGMIAKKRSFSHPEVQKQLLDKLKSGILVSHNAPYEKKWLRQHLNGFAEAERKGEIKYIDTMQIVSKLLPETPNASLRSFVEHYGIAYENAHRAYNDVKMQGEALGRFLKDLVD